MAGEFTLQLQEFVKKAGGNAEQVVRKVGIEITGSVIMKSPVDTGRFRANWVVGQGAIGQTTAATDQSGANTINKATAKIMQFKLGETIWLTNSLPYARRLEYGWSDQAPQGMVRLTIAEWQGYIAKAVKELK